MFFTYYSENSDVIIQNSNSYLSASVEQIRQGMDNYCDTVGRNMTSIAYSSFVQDFMMETSGSFSTLNGSYDFINNRREEFAGSANVRFSAIEDIKVSNFQHKCVVAGISVRSIDKSRMTGREIGSVCVILDASAMGSGLFGKNSGNIPAQFYLLDRNRRILVCKDGTGDTRRKRRRSAWLA